MTENGLLPCLLFKAVITNNFFRWIYTFAVPIDFTKGIKMLYVFLGIKPDATHFVDTIRRNFEVGFSLAFVSTIQFVATLQVCKYFIIRISNV